MCFLTPNQTRHPAIAYFAVCDEKELRQKYININIFIRFFVCKTGVLLTKTQLSATFCMIRRVYSGAPPCPSGPLGPSGPFASATPQPADHRCNQNHQLSWWYALCLEGINTGSPTRALNEIYIRIKFTGYC